MASTLPLSPTINWGFRKNQLARQLAISLLKNFPMTFERRKFLFINKADSDLLHRAYKTNLVNLPRLPVYKLSHYYQNFLSLS